MNTNNSKYLSIIHLFSQIYTKNMKKAIIETIYIKIIKLWEKRSQIFGKY